MKKLLFLLNILVTVSAIVSGLMLVTHPNGETMGLPMSILDDTAFPDYFYPGILLVLLVGVPHLLSIYYLGKRHVKQYEVSLFAAILLIGWIIAQMIYIHSGNWLHYTCLGIGVLEVLISLQLRGKWVV
ncbi:MAG: hypothetical protein U0T56_00260 [Ferruginibacter sp.]